MGGAGIKAAEFVRNNNATDLIVGFVGPNASQSLNALNLKMFKAPDQNLTVKEALNLYLKGNLSIITSSNVMSRAGSGAGMGRGMGRRRGQF
jgi:predicted Fe-Mo cluster-binding NifX family protein